MEAPGDAEALGDARSLGGDFSGAEDAYQAALAATDRSAARL